MLIPHMANLSWIFLFIVFNMSLLLTLFSTSFPSMMMPSNKPLYNTNTKKWQW